MFNIVRASKIGAALITGAVMLSSVSTPSYAENGAVRFSVGSAGFIVGVGTSIESSVLITANLVDLKVPQIWAKAISQSHGKILSHIGANHVIYPEAEAGERVAHRGRILPAPLGQERRRHRLDHHSVDRSDQLRHRGRR